MSPPAEISSSPGRYWAPILLLSVGLFASFSTIWKSDFTRVQGGPGDGRLVHFSLEHAHRFVSGVPGHEGFWDPPLFYPARSTAAYTDTMIGFVPFYSPLRWLGASPTTAFQWWFPIVLGLTFGVAYWGLRRLLRLSPLAASAGAYVFAFSAPRIYSFGHPQMVPWLYWGLACCALGRLVLVPPDAADGLRRHRLWLAVLVLSLTAQAYGAFYPFFFFVFVVGIGFVLALANAAARARLRSILVAEGPDWAFAAATGALLLAPLARRYLLTAEMLGTRPIGATLPLLPRPLSWWLPPPTSRLYGDVWQLDWVRAAPDVAGRLALAHGIGVVTPILAIVGLWLARRHGAIRLMVAVCVVLIGLTTFWPGGWTLWTLVHEAVPGASAIRAVSRFGQVLVLPAALGLAWLLNRPSLRRHTALATLVVVAMVIDQWPRIHARKSEPFATRAALISQAIDPSCEAFYLDWSAHGRFIDEDAMWAAMLSGVPTINGRYGNAPHGWSPLRRRGRQPIAGPSDDALRAWLERYSIDPAGICRVRCGPDGQYSSQRLAPKEAGCDG